MIGSNKMMGRTCSRNGSQDDEEDKECIQDIGEWQKERGY
jgi:hypothetical protein